MKKQMMKARLRRMKKKKAPETEDEDEATPAADPAAAPAAGAEPVAPKDIIREGWLKIHAESLLDDETYPELL